MIGGTEQSVKLLAEGLVESGFETAVFSYDGDGNNSQNIVNGVLVFKGIDGKDETNFKSLLMRCFWNSDVLSDLTNVISQFNPDVVNINNFETMSPSIWKFFKQKNIPVVHTIRDPWLASSPLIPETKRQIVYFYPIIVIWRYFMRRLSNKYVSYVTSPSQYMIDKFTTMKYFKNAKQVVIPNSINIDISETREIIAKKAQRYSPHVRFMYAGHLANHKGILNLLDVWTCLQDRDISLTICGDGPLRKNVINAAKKDTRIKYTGQLTKDELRDQYIAADVLIVPSIWEETFGRVIIEGNQYGLPVIGSNRGGIPEVLSETGGGITFQFDSLSDLKDKILMFKDRNEIKRYLNPILDNIEKYQNSNNIERYIQLYSEASGNSSIR